MSSEKSESAIIYYGEFVGHVDTTVQEKLWRCPACAGELIQEGYQYCPSCGVAIRFDEREFKKIKARDLRAGDKIKPVELHGAVVTVESVSLIPANSWRNETVGYICIHGCSYVDADNEVEIVVIGNSTIK